MKGRVLLLALTVALDARADVDVRMLASALEKWPAKQPPIGMFSRPAMSATIELPDGEDPRSFGLPKIGSRFSVARGSLAELAAIATAHPAWRVTWSAPMRLFSDRAAAWARVPAFRNDTGLTGKGVVVGIVDAGIDVTHPDFRNADGTSRIAYYIDFSEDPQGLHPELESLCSEDPICKREATMSTSEELRYRVLTASDIDAIIGGKPLAPLPEDPEGHGTHVASLAAGNGGSERKYVGMAPEATLVVVKAANREGFIDNATIPVAASLVFSLAERLGASSGVDKLPAVVNLSLGTDFGNHDGTSALEKSLADLVGNDHPGRAIVAAAGNSAGLLVGKFAFPSPLGIHTEVHVPERSSNRVPLVVPPPRPGAKTLTGAMLVWASFRPGDDVSVGVDHNDGELVPPQRPGSYLEKKIENVEVAVVNGTLKAAMVSPEDANAAAIVISGSWPSSRTFAIRLEGRGTANIWVQTGGGLGDEGALLPAAAKEATIAIPASSPSVIAVGATLNRTEWVDWHGTEVTVPIFGSVRDPEPDSVAFFSAAGPTTDLRMKPDLVAPGAFVVGAMAKQANPNDNPNSAFAGSGPCDEAVTDCAVVDAEHAVLSGTSMASPIVTGAVALLFQARPERTQDEILTLLQAGARFPKGLVRLDTQLGAGALDLGGVLDVERVTETPVVREPAGETSWMSLGASYAHPDPSWRIPGILALRDQDGLIADGFEGTVTLEVDHGTVTEQPERVAPGFYRFAVAAGEGTGGDDLRVTVVNGNQVLLEKRVSIAVDVNVARQGFSARGGCATRSPARGVAEPLAVAGLALTVLLGRRRTNAARRVRSRDRTDT